MKIPKEVFKKKSELFQLSYETIAEYKIFNDINNSLTNSLKKM